MIVDEKRKDIREGLVRIEVAHLSGMSIEGVTQLEWHETTVMVLAAHWDRAEKWTDINLDFLSEKDVVINLDGWTSYCHTATLIEKVE